MFENEDVCEIVLFMGDITDYESLNFSCGVFTIILGCMCMQTCHRMAKDW